MPTAGDDNGIEPYLRTQFLIPLIYAREVMALHCGEQRLISGNTQMKRPRVRQRAERSAVTENADHAQLRIQFVTLAAERIDTHRQHVADPHFRIRDQESCTVV